MEDLAKKLKTHGQFVQNMLKQIEKTAKTLERLGLTKQAALQHAGELFELKFRLEDLEKSPPAPLRQVA